MVLACCRRTGLARAASLPHQLRRSSTLLSVAQARANIAAREDGPAGVHAFTFLDSRASAPACVEQGWPDQADAWCRGETDEPRSAEAAGPLEGLPVAVKDTFCIKGWTTTACSDVLAGARPLSPLLTPFNRQADVRHCHRGLAGFISPYTATPVALLQAAGAHIVGKTAHDEFSMGASSTNLPASFASPPTNPWYPPGVAWEQRELRSCGGSSGGSAGAVAAQMAWA